MSDYTPTTEEVRERYASDEYTALPDLVPEFDRWLAEVKAEQDKATTERITALLDTLHRRESKSGIHESKLCAACRAIALIKGEN